MADSRLDGLSKKTTAIAARVGPSVVHIDQGGPTRLKLTSGLGSGIVVDDEGHILTNAHVLDGGRRLIVTLPGSERLRANLLGTDELCDLALLETEAKPAAGPVKFGVSPLLVGQVVLALGNPTGSDWTVTMGVVSAVDRSINRNAGTLLDGLIQTDAVVTPGASGGPLVALDGSVVGITTAIFPSGQGLSFAIPAAASKKCLAQLLAIGRVRHPWLGIVGQTEVIGSRWVDMFELPVSRGVLVTQLLSGGPAAAAGVQVFDLIVGLNGEVVCDMISLRDKVGRLRVGEVAELTLLKGMDIETLSLTIDELPEELRRRQK